MTILFYSLVVLTLSLILITVLRKPSLNKNWSTDMRILATAKFDKNFILLSNIRDAKYRSIHDYDVNYSSKIVNLNEVEELWFSITHFGPTLGKLGAAHVFLSFGLKDGSYISISAEARRLQGELFSWKNIIGGLLHKNEIVYIVANERDLISIRTTYWNNDMFLYKLNVSKKDTQTILVDVLKRTNKLNEAPEFFHTITNNCTTNIMKHLYNAGLKVPKYSLHYVIQAQIDSMLYNNNLINNTPPLKETRKRNYVTQRAKKYKQHKEFSKKIREDS